MVQASTKGAMAKAAEPEKTDEDPPPSWFTYEGPKISASVSMGTSKEISLFGFKAVTNIVHKQSIAWGTLTAAVNGPLQTEIGIKGPRKSVSMDLGAKLTLAPGGFIHRIRARASAKGVEVEANGGEDNDDDADVSAQVVEVENDGTRNDTGVNLNANVNHNQG